MAERVERLPFTVYDIMGYLVPGLYLSLYIAAFFECTEVRVISEPPITVWKIGAILLFIIEAYILGHIIAFVSAETLERICVAFFGYPSKTVNLDRNDDRGVIDYCRKELRIFFNTSCFGRLSKALLLIIFLPHTITLFIMSNTIFYRIAIKPLGPDVNDRVSKNFKKLFKTPTNGFEKSSHRYLMIDHFVFRLDDRVAAKQYNYVTLYGFCRNMSLAVYVVFWFDVLAFFLGTICSGDLHEEFYVDGYVNIGASILLMLAFLKFFRRYSEQAIMAFSAVTDDEIKSLSR